VTEKKPEPPKDGYADDATDEEFTRQFRERMKERFEMAVKGISRRKD
jgi:hypothetical protein